MTLEESISKMVGNATPKQQEFFKAKTRHVGYGGAKGSGKSHAIRAKATLLAYEYPGIQMLIVRRTLPELRSNHTLRLMAAYNTFPEAIKYSDKDKEFVFPNGSRLKLGFCDNEADVLQYQGQEYDVIFIDEGTQFTEYQYGWLSACLRGTGDYPKRIYITCNPGGVGHAWVKRLFVDKDYKRSEDPKDYMFIPARVWDNQPLFDADEGYKKTVKELKKKYKVTKLTPKMNREAMWGADYVKTLNSLADEALRKAWLDGDWSVFKGQYFGEFEPDVHVIPEFEIPSYWRKTAAIDYGLDMFAVLWFAVSPDGRVYVYRGYEQDGLIVSKAAIIFRELTQETLHGVYAPPDLWNRRNDTGKSAAQIFAENGVGLIKSSNDRIQGWLSVKEYIQVKREGGKVVEGYPRMLFFNTCSDIIRCLPLLQHDTVKINDVDSKGDHSITHSPDALRYWCSPHQMGSKEPEVIKPDPFHMRRPKQKGVPRNYMLGGI